MNLRTVVVNLQFDRSYASDVLEFVDLMHLCFPLLKDLTVYGVMPRVVEVN
jgi:hypothetical protein